MSATKPSPNLARESTEWPLNIQRSKKSDRQGLVTLHKAAFGPDEGPVIADLVVDLLKDPTAMPLLSLMATDGDNVIGHILFTTVKIIPSDDTLPAMILAPLAVHPEAQSQGIGGKLIKEGLRRLTGSGVALVFVLGHPGYYPKFGFKPAGTRGFEAPYPILEKIADAWMVKGLYSGVINRVSGKVQCSDVLNQPQYWRE